jgi:protein-S-isoprenylcysteine O-methyltransferase Ste14
MQVNAVRPAVFAVRRMRGLVKILSAALLLSGIVVWLWSAVLIVTKASKGRLVTRLSAPEEERTLARTVGAGWDEYCAKVRLPWR